MNKTVTSGEKIKRNIIANILYQCLVVAIGIFMPRLVLVSLGSEANGLLNSTSQIIVYLALFEGGVGFTITQALYGPIARKSNDDVNVIMSTANQFYRNVGKLYFVGLIVLAIVYSLTVESTFSVFEVIAVVLLTGLPQVINFFFQGKYRTLISVDGKSYVLTLMTSLSYIATSFVKIALLLLGFGVIAIQLMFFIVSLVQMIFILSYVKKTYPWLNIKVPPQREKIGERKSVFVHQISGFIFSSTDITLLTYFCDLKVVSVYAMYTVFFSMINSLVTSVVDSFVFEMGQKFNSDRAVYMKMHNTFETFSIVLTFATQSVLCLCIIPFLKIYTRDITDIDYIYIWLPYFFSAVYLLQSGRYASLKVVEYSGEFKKTQWHAALEAVLNLGVSIIAVINFGIYGVLIGTITALVVRNVLMINYTCKKILNTKQRTVYLKWGVNIVLFIALQYAVHLLNIEPASYFTVVLYAACLMVVSLFVYVGCAFLYDKASCKYVVSILKAKLSSLFVKSKG